MVFPAVYALSHGKQAVSADEPGREYAVPAERPSGTFASGQLRLHLLKFIGRDDGLVVPTDVILLRFTLIPLFPL